MNMRNLNPATLTMELQHGLENDQFILHYQPIINTDTDQIAGIEVLLRWQHPTRGLLSPDVFLSWCENTGFIVPLGEWVLRHACSQIKKWHAMGYSKLFVSVNLSTHQLTHPDFLDLIDDVLKTNNIAPQYLKLEITESTILENDDMNIKILKTLRNRGVQLALDDFGMGYSSLNYLKQYPFNILKIDKSFVKELATNITSVAIVESIITLGKSLGLTLIAEGIENKNQLYMLKKMKCDMVQGYLYSKPISAEEFTHQLSLAEKTPQKKSQCYEYKILQSEHYDQAVNIITHSFCEHEPMTKYLGITHSEFLPFAKVIVQKAIKDGLSIVALDENKLSACTIVDDYADPINISHEFDPKFKIIFSLLEHLSNDFFNNKEIEKGHLAHLFITAVAKNYHGKGLSSQINLQSTRLAEQKGFDFMCCEFTHPYNEKGTIKNLKNNKLLIKSYDYKDFIFEGKKPFENLTGSVSSYIWELYAGARLRFQFKTL